MVAMMRVDYRYLRLASVPVYVVALGLLSWSSSTSSTSSIGGSARWLKLGPLPAIHPAEIAKLALIIYLAHWFAKRGARVGSFWGGTVPFLIIAGPSSRSSSGSRTSGTTIGHRPDGVHDVLHRRRRTRSISARCSGWPRFGARSCVGLPGYQMDRIRAWLNPWSDPLGAGYHTVQGLLALGLGGIFGAGLGESRMAGGLFLPNAFNDFIFAIIGEEFGLIGAGVVIALFVAPGLRWHPRRARARRTRSGRCSPPGSPPGCASRRSSTSASS